MARKVYRVVPAGGNWQVKHEGAVHTKEAAVDAGRKVAIANQPSQLVVHKADGTIETASWSVHGLPGAGRVAVGPGLGSARVSHGRPTHRPDRDDGPRHSTYSPAPQDQGHDEQQQGAQMVLRPRAPQRPCA